ncbi:hypothetical protein [Georgenia sp. SUBG003]|uniref:hypothetical protein n=1 Tax=Georgenia sp. SUBG003 TaxID=1497974 RepID=UPI003AB51C3D
MTGKSMEDVRIVVSGVGAAGSAIIKLLKAQGARYILASDGGGALHRGGRQRRRVPSVDRREHERGGLHGAR